MPKNAAKTPEAIAIKAYTRVAECLWRSNASGKYYAFIKSGGKQFHRSLKTTDRALAERRLARYRQKVGKLNHGKEATGITFGARMKPSSLLRRKISVKQLKAFFGQLAVRNMTAKDCDEWVRQSAGVWASNPNLIT